MPRLATLSLVSLFACGAAAALKRRYNTGAKLVPGAINVHLVPHSHDDVGWLKTVDQYATGANNSIQHANVDLTLDTVLVSLKANPDRHFIVVEQAFFQRWIEVADDTQLADMAAVVAAGQLEFINGGWCMHDEAAPSYVDMIDQTALGHRLIKERYGGGAVPRVTWQIDPFGHSATQASLLSSPLSGYEALYFGRLDYQDRQQRINETNLEFVWRPSPDLKDNGQVFTGAMFGYGPPGGMCWDDASCTNTQPIVDDVLNTEYNVPYWVNVATTTAQQLTVNYKNSSDGTFNLLWPMGSDFQYTNAISWYKNMDKLIHYVNLGTATHGVNMLYSTPSIFTDAKLAQGLEWSVKTDDFMPYADSAHAMWSGYFTSRAALKGYVRDSSAVFQASKQLQFMGARPSDISPSNPLYRLERAMGVTQHHDGVSGTSKQHVAYDYARRLAWGREDAAKGNAAALTKLTGFAGAFLTCDLMNATICPALEAAVVGTPILVTVYNQQGAAAALLPVRLSVSMGAIASYSVMSASGGAITAQLIPASPADTTLRTSYYDAPATPMGWLMWQAAVDAMGGASFFVTPSATAVPSTHVSVPRHTRSARLGASDQTITNGVVTLTISAATGMLSSFSNSVTGASAPITQTWGYYLPSAGDAPTGGPNESAQASGAYIFRTNVTTYFDLNADTPATFNVATGPIVQEVWQVITPYITQKIRLWNGSSTADIEFTVGPIPLPKAPEGKEIVTRFATNLRTNATWATDSNLREMIPRVRDYRSSWDYTVFEPVAGNYVPVNGRITTADVATGTTLSISTDRTQGGASIVDGSLELMVHRRLQHDDSRGVGEPLNEPGLDVMGKGLIVRGTHRLSLDTADTAASNGRGAMQDLTFRPQLFFSPLAASTTPSSWISAGGTPTFSGLTAPLPPNVHLLTTHALSTSSLLLRLAHMYASGEDKVLSAPANVTLTTLFSGATLSDCVETTLPGAQLLASVPVRTVQTSEGPSTYPVIPAPPTGASQAVTLAPMEVRAWSCSYA